MPRKKDPIQKQIDDITEQLEGMRDEVLEAAEYETVGSFHGAIGGKNNTYTDAIREVFLSPDQFIAEWKEGALEQAAEWDQKELEKYGRRYQNHAVHDILRLLQIPIVEEYIDLFLERNFYKQHHARVRKKPEDSLWEVWFGPKNQEYGLFITPRYKDDEWENDVSHIRRAPFEYWTIEHVLTSGFVIPGKERRQEFKSLDDIFSFYQNVVIRSAGSVYGTALAEAYEEFVREQSKPEIIPFLIPEFRFEGSTGPHKYRLDFTILSASQQLKVGIELSPWSTHGKVKGKKKLREAGGEAAIEAEQIKKWESDTKKRNDYFAKFGITVLTFTDSELADMEEVFGQISPYLLPPKRRKGSKPAVRSAIDKYKFDPANKK
jgi:hypothetical protein